VELARAGMNISACMDRRDKLPHVAEVQERSRGRECEFFNFNAADEDKRKECVEQIRQRLATDSGTLRVLMHSLAWGALKPLAGAQTVANKKQIESTADIMGHSLVYWVQECLLAGLFDKGARIFAMTSSGSTRAIPEYGPVGAAKAILEAHIRQLALELAPAGITANDSRRESQTPRAAPHPWAREADGKSRACEPNKRLTTPRTWGAASPVPPSGHLLMTGNTIHVDGGENIVG
jgi:enoyl-[acyl-carrier-protein] reductase (NADH)